MRLEFSFLGFIEFMAYIAIYGMLWRSLAAYLVLKNPSSSIGKAMAFIY